MLRNLAVPVAALVVCLLSLPTVLRADEEHPGFYFGQARPLSATQISGLRALLRAADGKCSGSGAEIGQDCKEAEDALKLLFNNTFRGSLPDVLVYFEEQNGDLVPHRPLLIWRGKNTPYIFGARHLYVLIVSDEKLSLDARLTTIVETSPNPFLAVQTLLGFTPAEPKAPEPKTSGTGIAWAPIGAEDEAPYLGWARLDIEMGSINRLTISARRETVTRTVTTEGPAGVLKAPKVKIEGKVEGPAPLPGDAPEPPFAEIAAHISNSKAGRAGFGIAFGSTFDVEGTALGEDGGDLHENGYALAKVYALRPRLRVGPESKKLYRPSIALLVGTNIASDPFDELVLGVGVGHLVGKLGLMAGVNFVKPAPLAEGAGDTEDRSRERKLFVGVEYSF